MEGAAKLLDTLIKAPLWLYLALALGLSVVMLPVPLFRAAGLSAQTKVLGVSLLLLAVLSWSLFAISALARIAEASSTPFSTWRYNGKVRRRYVRLPKESRAILAVVDEYQWQTFRFRGSHQAINALRDGGMIERFEVDDYDPTLVTYRITSSFDTDMGLNRAILRPLLRHSVDAEAEAFVKQWRDAVVDGGRI